jgi:hypothetical protein
MSVNRQYILAALVGLLAGENRGKRLVKVA